MDRELLRDSDEIAEFDSTLGVSAIFPSNSIRTFYIPRVLRSGVAPRERGDRQRGGGGRRERRSGLKES